jgi:hypothetical protein
MLLRVRDELFLIHDPLPLMRLPMCQRKLPCELDKVAARPAAGRTISERVPAGHPAALRHANARPPRRQATSPDPRAQRLVTSGQPSERATISQAKTACEPLCLSNGWPQCECLVRSPVTHEHAEHT